MENAKVKIFFSVTVIFLLEKSIFSAIKTTPEQFSERYYVEVDSCRFKFAIDYLDQSFKVRISKEIDGKWLLQNRYVDSWDHYEGVNIIDWNHDGFKDVRIKFVGHNEFENFLFMYDDSLKQYRNIEMYWWYSGSYEVEKSVPNNKNYYYSFIRWGCSGDAWESILFTIEDFKIVVVGSMDINYCDKPYEIRIYKHLKSEDVLRLVTIGMDYINDNYGEGPEIYAWENYVNNYWKKHSAEFID